MADSALHSLYERVPEALRARLAQTGPADAWLEQAGDELVRSWLQLTPAELEELIDLAVDAGAGSALLLRRLEELAGTKAARKLARRGIHRLKSRGVAVEPAIREPASSVLRPLEEERAHGLATAPDALGRRTLFLSVPGRGEVRMYEIGVSDTDGVIHLQAFRTRRREVRAFSRQLRERQGVRAVDIDASALRALVKRAAALGQKGESRTLAEVLRGELGETPGERLRALLSSEVSALEDAAADELVLRALESGELLPWPPAGEAAEDLVARIESIEHSPLVLTELQRRERRLELVREARDRVLDAAYRERVAARLEESAVFSMADPGGKLPAAMLQVAVRVRRAEDPLAVPYLQRMLDVWLGSAQERPLRRDPTRLIVPR